METEETVTNLTHLDLAILFQSPLQKQKKPNKIMLQIEEL